MIGESFWDTVKILTRNVSYWLNTDNLSLIGWPSFSTLKRIFDSSSPGHENTAGTTEKSKPQTYVHYNVWLCRSSIFVLWWRAALKFSCSLKHPNPADITKAEKSTAKHLQNNLYFIKILLLSMIIIYAAVKPSECKHPFQDGHTESDKTKHQFCLRNVPCSMQMHPLPNAKHLGGKNTSGQ